MGSKRERITLQEAAARLGIHYMTAYRYIRTGRLPASRDGVQWKIDPADLAKLRAPTQVPSGRAARRRDGTKRLAGRMVAGDEAGAWSVVESALSSGVEPADVYLDLLVPALRQVGDGWEAGVLTVADEHRATGVAQRLVGRLGPRFARRGRKRGTVVLGVPAGDPHALPSAILADLLRGVGFDALDIGADAPAESFVDTARQANRLVALMIGPTTGAASQVRRTVRAIRAAGIAVPVLVGGAAVRDEDDARRLGADGWSGRDGRAAVEAVERLATRSAS